MDHKQTVPELFLSNNFHECHKWSHYLAIYEKHLSRFSNKNPVLLEIGVRRGGSLELWKKYFGESSTVIGVDIDKSCSELQDNGFDIYIGDQSDQGFLEEILNNHPTLDIVIDDGSHIASDIIKSFEYLYKRMSPNGIYIIEDVSSEILSNDHTISLSDYFQEIVSQINLGFVEQSFLNEADEVAQKYPEVPEKIAHSGLARMRPPTHITSTTSSICFYPNMIILEKAPQSIRTSIKTAGMNEGIIQGYRTFLVQKEY